MGFTGALIWELESGGDDTNNGGGFDSGVSGFATDLTVTANTGNTSTPEVSSASYNFVAGDVNHWLFIKAGTNWIPGFYQITSVDGTTHKATVNAAIGAATIWQYASRSDSGGPNTTAGVATTGTPTSGTWGIDYSQNTSSHFTSTHFSIGNPTTTQLTDGDNTVGKNWIGNIISITSGTGFTVQRVAVVSTSGTTATVDKSLGTAGSSGGNGRLGGALGSPGTLGSLFAGNHYAYCKNATYSLTSATTNISGGAPQFASGIVVGYSTHRYFGNTDTQPIWQAGVASVIVCTSGSQNTSIVNLTLDGNKANFAGAKIANAIYVYCTIKNFDTASVAAFFIGCYATANSAAQFASGAGNWAIYCEATANTATQFINGICAFCLSYANTGASTDGFAMTGNMGFALNCISYGNGRDGFRTASGNKTYINCHAEGNATAFNNTGVAQTLIACSHYSNGSTPVSEASQGPMATLAVQALTTGTVFTNAAGGDFSLNNLASQGAALRALGYAGYRLNTFPAGLTLTYQDIGAAQHLEAGGAAVAIFGS